MIETTNFNIGFKIPFRDYVLNDIVVTDLIESRFYGSFLATLYTDKYTPSFPLATFTTVNGSMPNLNIIQRFPLVINSFSNSTYDEAYEVDSAILDTLGGLDGPISITKNITIRPLDSGRETYDEDARIFGIERRYSVIYIPA